MHVINPSLCTAVSFIIFIAFLVWKRFFNLNQVLDTKITNINNEINHANLSREKSYENLQNITHTFEKIDIHLNELSAKTAATCETLTQSIRKDIAMEIAKRKNEHEKYAELLEKSYRKAYQDHLINTMIDRLISELQKQNLSALHAHEIERSLMLMHDLKIAA